jgi:uncharacterized protein
VPDKILAQLGNRVQHALRAFTPRDQKAVTAAAQTFRPNPALDTARVIMELGKALVSFLEGNGTPTMVERTMIRPPAARLGPITPAEREAVIEKSPVKGRYDQAIDAESAYEVLQKRMQSTAVAPGPSESGQLQGAVPAGGMLGQIGAIIGTIFGTNSPRGQRLSSGQLIARRVTRSVTDQVVGKVAADIGKSLGGSMGGSVGRAIVRGALGGILRR